MKIQELRNQLNLKIKNYPAGISPIKGNPLTGTAFFPAGDGLFKEGNFKLKNHYPIMVVGQDYDNEINFYKVAGLPNQSEFENKNRTWGNLIKILGEENLDKCFFTNAIMGLREGSSKNTGKSLAFKNDEKSNEFLKENIAFFQEQIKITEPTSIISLGIHVPKFMAHVFPKECGKLSMVNSFSDLDTIIPESKIEVEAHKRKIKIIFLTHPALYFSNAARRKNGQGLAFERNLLEGVWGEG